jgi:hypothetical protein
MKAPTKFIETPDRVSVPRVFEKDAPCVLPEFEKVKIMKKRLIVLSTTVASVAIIAVCLGVHWNTAAAADKTSTTSGTVEGASVVAPAPVPGSPAPAGLSYGVSEVLKLHQAGIGKDVILNYINSIALPYHLTADDVIYLRSAGIPPEVTQALILRDGQLQQKAAQHYAQQQQMAVAANAATPGAPSQAPPVQVPPPVVVPSTPPPDVSYIGADYGDPYYYGGYPYYYGAPVVIGGGLGWGHGGHYEGGFRGGFGGGHGGGGRR